ncbi:MAG: type IV pilin protein [Gammaproteobacteria bacterium]|nr:type IV pilin protein [Gammaproteobacteria bacterium]
MRSLQKQAGFTLIELVIVLVIIGILAIIVLPSYTQYIRQAKITDATDNLTQISLMMEQAYQDNRSYRTAGANTCSIANFTTDFFSFSCISGSNTSYTWTASVLSTAGMGALGDYKYSIDQDNNRLTMKFKGQDYGAGQAGWQVK